MRFPFPITTFLLASSALYAIFFPHSIQSIAHYPNEEVLIVDWGIYALTLALILTCLSLPKRDSFKCIAFFLLFCVIASMCWNFYMFGVFDVFEDQQRNHRIKKEFLIIANGINFLSVVELGYFLYRN